MKMRDQFRFVRQNMKKNRTRVIMTIVATAMGCAFLMMLASVGFGLHDSVVRDITEGRVLNQIEIYGKEIDHRFYSLNDADIAELESYEAIRTVTREQRLAQSPYYTKGDAEGYIGNVRVVHWPSEIEAGFELYSGRMPEEEDEVVVGYHFAERLQRDAPEEVDRSTNAGQENGTEEEREANAELDSDTESGAEAQTEQETGIGDDQRVEFLGETMSLTVEQHVETAAGETGEEKETFTVTIVGIADKPSRQWMHDEGVIMSEGLLANIERFTGTPLGRITYEDMSEGMLEQLAAEKEEGRTYDPVHVYTYHVEDVAELVSELEQHDFATHSIVNQLDEVNLVFFIMKAGLFFVGAIAVIIASIGIYNTMSMAVTERTSDIGIMKAIGANPQTIKRIFLFESGYIGILGALIGAFMAYGISGGVNIGMPLAIELFLGDTVEDFRFSSIPVTLTVSCIALSVLVAIVSGWRPAYKATRIDVLKAMRRDI